MSAASFHIGAGQVQSQSAQGFIGQVVGSFESMLLTNQNPQASQVSTITVGAATNATLYQVIVDGAIASYTSDATATVAEIHAGLLAACLAAGAVRGRMVASGTSPTLTLTAVTPGLAHTVTVTDNSTGDLGAVVATNAAATAAAVSFGKLMVQTGYGTDLPNPIGHVPDTSDYSAQVETYTIAGFTASYYTGSVSVNGRVYPWGGIVWDTNLATTCTAIAAGINAVLPAETVIADGSSGTTILLTAEVEGAEFSSEIQAVGHAAAEATKAFTTGPSTATSLDRQLAGISRRRLDIEDVTLGGDDPAYPANIGVDTVTRGKIWVENSQGVSYGDDVYVDLGAASATKGDLFNTAGTDRVWIAPSKLRWLRDEVSTASNDIALLSVMAGRVG